MAAARMARRSRRVRNPLDMIPPEARDPAGSDKIASSAGFKRVRKAVLYHRIIKSLILRISFSLTGKFLLAYSAPPDGRGCLGRLSNRDTRLGDMKTFSAKP